MSKIEKIQEAIDKIKIELVMSAYNNGWLNEEYKKKLKVLEDQLYKEINKNNDNSSIFNTK